MIDDYSSTSDIPIQIFQELVKTEKITNVSLLDSSPAHPEIEKRLKNASSKDLDEANRRLSIVIAKLQGDSLLPKIPSRTLSRWISDYRYAKNTYGGGFIGLLPKPRIGNCTGKLNPESRKLLQTFISNSYESFKQKKKKTVYGEYCLACKEKGIESASYNTFRKEVKKRRGDQQTLKRKGRRAAYQEQPFYIRLDRETPRHGEHPFHIVHIDYTQVDLELVDSYTGKNLGRPWLGFAISASTRRILSAYLSFDPPSRCSDMMLIREMVRRYGRMPQIVVVDGGANFETIYFETLLALFECTKKTRPPAEPRSGSVIERMFGTTNTQFFHNLQGNTQIMKFVRQVTKSVNPKNLAIWTLPKLYDYLCIYCYEIYDKAEHPSLGQSPQEAFALQIQLHGSRSHRFIPYNDNFKLLTLPATKRGTAKVIPNKGIKNNYIYYWTEAFNHHEVENKSVEVRVDPFDLGKVYAFVRKQWVECYSEQYSVFKGRSEKFIKLATEEVLRRKKLHAKKFSISATDIDVV